MPTVRAKIPPPTSNDGRRFQGLPPNLTTAELLALLPNLELSDRIDAAHWRTMDSVEACKVLDKYLLKRGVPLVIDGWHNLPDWPSALSLRWLERNWEGGLWVKNMFDGVMSEVAGFGKYLRMMGIETEMVTAENYNVHSLARHYAKDLDCPGEWQRGLEQFLPEYVHYMGKNDLMATLPEEKRPANLMVYVGGEGTYTPIHTDMCGTLGHNLIVDVAEPNASALWIVVPSKDRKPFEQFLARKNVKLHTERYLLSLSDWAEYGGKLYLIDQRKGDFALIPSMAAHQVWNRGGGTVKVAWNRTMAGTLKNAMSIHLDEYRVVCRDEQFMVKQTIQDATIHLFNAVVRQIRSGLPKTPADQRVANNYLLLLNMFTANMREEAFPPDAANLPAIKEKLDYVPDAKYDVVCSFCRCNIWNTFLTCATCSNSGIENDSFDICLECYCSGRSCAHLTSEHLTLCVQQDWTHLLNLHKKFTNVAYRLVPNLKETSVYSLTSPTPTLLSITLSQLSTLPSPSTLSLLSFSTSSSTSLTESEADTLATLSSTCHFHAVPHPTYKCASCTCGRSFCYDILRRAFNIRVLEVLRLGEEWDCPVCEKRCYCKSCGGDGRDPNSRSEGAGREVEVVLAVDYSKVAFPGARNWLVQENRGNEKFWKRGGEGAEEEGRGGKGEGDEQGERQGGQGQGGKGRGKKRGLSIHDSPSSATRRHSATGPQIQRPRLDHSSSTSSQHFTPTAPILSHSHAFSLENENPAYSNAASTLGYIEDENEGGNTSVGVGEGGGEVREGEDAFRAFMTGSGGGGVAGGGEQAEEGEGEGEGEGFKFL